jgi:hypothetical protein
MVAPSSLPVERRKRVSRSPVRKLLLWGSATSAACLLAAVFGGQIWLESYLKSEQFRQHSQKAVGKALRAETRLSHPQRSGTSLYLDSLESRGLAAQAQPPARFREMDAFGVRAELDLTALWRRTWKVESLSIQRATIDLSSPAPMAASGAPPAAESEPAPVSFLAKFLPNRTEIAAIRVERADINRGDNRLRQVRIHATPAGAEAEWNLTVEDGELRIGTLPDLEPAQVQSAKLLVKKDTTILQDAKLLLRSGGHLEVMGEWPQSGNTQLRARLHGVQIQPFLAKWWQSRFVGAVDGEWILRQSASRSPEWEATLSMKNGKLEALPILSELDTFLGSPRFRSVPLRTASAKILQNEKGTEIKNLKMDADGQLRLEGDVFLRDGQMEGNLLLGLNVSLVKWLPGARSKVFTEERDGCVWTPFHVSGPITQPVEDLSKRLAAAAAGAVLDKVTDLLAPQKKPADPNQPANPPPAKDSNPLVEPIKNALDAARSLLPGK